MTRPSVSSLRAGVASRMAVPLLLAAALLTSMPFGASLVLGLRAGADKVASVFVCFASGAPLPDAQTGRPGPANDRGMDCVLCQTLCLGIAPLASRPGVVIAAPIQRLNLPWMVADRAAPTTRTRLPHWARAPPAGAA